MEIPSIVSVVDLHSDWRILKCNILTSASLKIILLARRATRNKQNHCSFLQLRWLSQPHRPTTSPKVQPPSEEGEV